MLFHYFEEFLIFLLFFVKENLKDTRIQNVEIVLVEIKFDPQQDDSPPQRNLALTDCIAALSNMNVSLQFPKKMEYLMFIAR